MNKVTHYGTHAARYLLGALFLFSGLNGFFQFAPMPSHGGTAGQFMGGLAASGYFFPLLKGTETLVGLLLLGGRLVPLALTVLAPITLHIFLFHAFLAPDGLGMSVGIVLLHGWLAYAYRDAYRGVLSVSARPSTAASAPVEAPRAEVSQGA